MPKKNEKEALEEIDLLDNMLSALVEVLEEKGVLTQDEWEKKIKDKLQSKASLTSFREL
jgi:hypothetical protein